MEKRNFHSLHFKNVRAQCQLQSTTAHGHWGRLTVVLQGGLVWPQGHPVAPQIFTDKRLKDSVSFSVTSVIIIDYRHHHQHSHCLPPAVAGCQNIKVCFSSNCSPSSLFSVSSSSPQTAFFVSPSLLSCLPSPLPPEFLSPASQVSREFSSSSSTL